MKRLCRYFGFLINQEKGAVIIIAAIMIVVLFGFTALVIDVGQLYAVRRQMVSAADGGALAGAMENYEKNQAHKNKAISVAEDYAKENGAEYVNVAFTSEGGNSTMHVRASRLVNFTFARVLGFEDSMVSAVASVRLGPGNPLVPFVKIGYPCDCLFECEHDPPDPECDECEIVDNCSCESLGYVVRHDDDERTCAKPGDEIQLKYDDWKESSFASGNFGYVRLPDRQGGANLRVDIGGGYSGALEKVEACKTEIRGETGHKQGPLVKALGDRLSFVMKESPCSSYEEVKDDPYNCPLVVVVPLVHTKVEIDPDYNWDNKQDLWVKIVGYASFLLVLDDDPNVDDDDKVVHAILIEYIDWDRLQEIMPIYLEGYVLKLVKTEGDPFAGVPIS